MDNISASVETMPNKEETYKIIGAAMEVYNVLGPGFLEAVYQEALEIELDERGIPFVSQALVPIFYKTRQLHKEYNADLICYEHIILELKAVDQLTKNFQAQLLNYLKGSRLSVGILINFGHEQDLEWKRMVL